jgi:hypothetical protein
LFTFRIDDHQEIRQKMLRFMNSVSTLIYPPVQDAAEDDFDRALNQKMNLLKSNKENPFCAELTLTNNNWEETKGGSMGGAKKQRGP